MDLMQIVRQDRVVAVIRAPHVADPAGLAATLAEVGIRTVEFTFTIPGVLKVIRAATDSGALVGAGTVLHPDQAKAAIEAGARFLVSPILRPELVKAAENVPVILAGFSPTEVVAALEAGAVAVKLFPARVGGPSYVTDLLGPLPGTPLIPSGGVDETNAAAYLQAGAVAVNAGSRLVPPEAAAKGDLAEVARRAEAFVKSFSRVAEDLLSGD